MSIFIRKEVACGHVPEEGISALTPVLELFNTLNALRLEIADRGKILGIIRDGGDQAIYIPITVRRNLPFVPSV